VVADVALVALFGKRRQEDAHLEGVFNLTFKDGDFPRAGGVDGSLTGGEEGLSVRILDRFEAIGHEGCPGGELFPGLDVGSVGVLASASDEGFATFLAFPVVGTDVLEAHRGGFPLVRGAHTERDVRAVGFDGFEDFEEIVHGGGRLDADFLEGVFVVEEAVDDGSHRNTEDVFAVVGDPGGLGDVAEVLHAAEVIELSEVALFVELQGGIEGAAGDEIASGATFQLRVEDAVVFGGSARLEEYFDVGMAFLKQRDDCVLPDGQVVVTPAFDGDGNRLASGRFFFGRFGRFLFFRFRRFFFGRLGCRSFLFGCFGCGCSRLARTKQHGENQ